MVAFLNASLVCLSVGNPLVYVLKDDNIEVERGRRRQRRGGGGKEEQEGCKDARCQRTEVHRRWGKQREPHLVLKEEEEENVLQRNDVSWSIFSFARFFLSVAFEL